MPPSSAATMRAAVAHGRRDVRLERRPIPEPGPGEVRLRVEACGLCGSDRHLFATGMYTPQVVPGHEIAGRVDAVGAEVTGWGEGDPVVVEPLRACGRCAPCRRGLEAVCVEGSFHGVQRDGGFADFAVFPARRLFRIDDDLDPAIAALAEPAAVAIHGLRRVNLEPGQSVLVLGAGPVGLMTLVAARRLGAGSVSISARHAHQAEAARRLGADGVLAESDAAPGALTALPVDRRPDVVVETVGGSANTLQAAVSAVAPAGAISVLGLFTGEVTLPPYPLFLKEITLAWSNCYSRRPGRADFDDAVALVQDERERLHLFTTHQVSLDEIGRAYALAEERPADLVKLTVRP